MRHQSRIHRRRAGQRRLLLLAAAGAAIVAVVIIAAAAGADDDVAERSETVRSGRTPTSGASHGAIEPDELYLLSLAQDDIGDPAFVLDTYATGFISNDQKIANACEPADARLDVEGGGRVDGYARAFADFERRSLRLGEFYFTSSAELFSDSAGAAAYGDLDASIEEIRADAEIGEADCDGSIVHSIDEFPVEGIGEQVRGLSIRVIGNHPALYSTMVAFTRDRLFITVSFTGFDTPHENEFVRARALAQALDARVLVVLSGDLDLSSANVARIRAAEDAAAAARVVDSDLPAGWTIAPPDGEEFDPSDDYELTGQCAGADSFILPDALATNESDAFESARDETLFVAVNIFAHGDAAQSALRALDGNLDRCGGGMEEVMRRVLTDTIREDGGNIALLDVFRIESEDVALPDLADARESHRVRAVIHDDDFGVAVEIVTDVIVIRSGAALAVVVYTGYGEPTLSRFDREREVDLVERAVEKLAQAGESGG